MSRLIDADAFKERVYRAYGFAAGSNDPFQRGKESAYWDVAANMIDSAPTVEAVEIGPLAEWLARTSPAGSAFIRVGAELERYRKYWKRLLTRAAKEIGNGKYDENDG